MKWTPQRHTKLRFELAHAKRGFEGKHIDKITPLDLATWRGTLPAKSRQKIFRSFKQVPSRP